MSFTCIECFDTKTIDQGGAEITCPFCKVSGSRTTVKISGLGHGLGADGINYSTAVSFTSSKIVFVGTPNEILGNVVSVRKAAEAQARRACATGRNSISSGAIAIERHVRKALVS